VRKTLTLAVVLLLVLAACGGDDTSEAASDTGDSGSSAQGSGDAGTVVEPLPPGQATAVVDGLEFEFSEPGGVACTIASGEFSFSFIIGDNEIVLGGGGFESNAEWGGTISLRIANPEGEPGPIQYFANLTEHGAAGLAFDGSSMSYSGPMQKQPANDGSNPPPVDAGDGAISVTCS